MKLSNKVYDIMKWIVITVLPALVLLLNTVLPLYGVDQTSVQNITITITAATTFIGTLIGISSVKYMEDTKHEQ